MLTQGIPPGELHVSATGSSISRVLGRSPHHLATVNSREPSIRSSPFKQRTEACSGIRSEPQKQGPVYRADQPGPILFLVNLYIFALVVAKKDLISSLPNLLDNQKIYFSKTRHYTLIGRLHHLKGELPKYVVKTYPPKENAMTL